MALTEAVTQPHCKIVIKAVAITIPIGLSFASQATIMPVQPTSFVIDVDNDSTLETLKAPAAPINAADKNIVLQIILFTFIPEYLAVFILSPTTDISYPCFVRVK